MSNEFTDAEKEWQPPRLSDIKYSKVSKEHQQYLESKKRGKRNGKKEA